MILSIPRPQFFYFSYKVSMVARDGTATLLWENSHNILIKWAWDACDLSLSFSKEKGSTCTYPKRLSDWLARENNRIFLWRSCYARISYYFPSGSVTFFIVSYSQTTFCSPFLSLCFVYVRIFEVTRFDVVCLDVWCKLMSKNLPSITAINVSAVSNRKHGLFRLYRVYPAVQSVNCLYIVKHYISRVVYRESNKISSSQWSKRLQVTRFIRVLTILKARWYIRGGSRIFVSFWSVLGWFCYSVLTFIIRSSG